MAWFCAMAIRNMAVLYNMAMLHPLGLARQSLQRVTSSTVEKHASMGGAHSAVKG